MKITNIWGEILNVEVGDLVSFKSDIEQTGLVSKIVKNGQKTKFVLINEDGFEGGYIGGETEYVIDASSCY